MKMSDKVYSSDKIKIKILGNSVSFGYFPDIKGTKNCNDNYTAKPKSYFNTDCESCCVTRIYILIT